MTNDIERDFLHAVARGINRDRDQLPVVTPHYTEIWQAKFDQAIAIAKEFADDDRFDAEAFFIRCGYSKHRVQEAVNKIGRLTRADIKAANVALRRPAFRAEGGE
jgi:hypothetical protein